MDGLSEVELLCSSDDNRVVGFNVAYVERFGACHTSCFASLAQNASGCQMAAKAPLCAIGARRGTVSVANDQFTIGN